MNMGVPSLAFAGSGIQKALRESPASGWVEEVPSLFLSWFNLNRDSRLASCQQNLEYGERFVPRAEDRPARRPRISNVPGGKRSLWSSLTDDPLPQAALSSVKVPFGSRET